MTSTSTLSSTAARPLLSPRARLRTNTSWLGRRDF
jgi:hypothetical protein